MPLQNRVLPTGEILAIADRGLFTGNRGIIHDPATRTLLKRRWTSKAWIICLCAYKGMHREVMARHSWTELFFLDEVTALAAGHRPCFYCRREDALRFRAAWANGNGTASPGAPEMDAVLHAERLDGKAKRTYPFDGDPAGLPDGAMFAAAGDMYAVAGGRALRWSAAGYRPDVFPAGGVDMLTPPSTIRALSAGYRPVFHPSASEFQRAYR
jgi:hypothetical protein